MAFEKLHPKLWIYKSTLYNSEFPRNMVVYRDDSGDLLLHSVIELDENERKELEAFGKPKTMIVPSGIHRLDAPKYEKLYPGLHIVAPKRARKKVEEKVRVDQCAEEMSFPGVKASYARGGGEKELVYEMDLGAGEKALVFNDLLMNMKHLPGFMGWVMKIGGSTGFFGPTKLEKFLLLESPKEYANWLDEMGARSDIKIVTVSHGAPIVGNASEKLKSAAERARRL